jgi:hypothetical protein
MRRKFCNILVTAGLACLTLASSAESGTIIHLNSEMFGSGTLNGEATIYLETNRLRIDSNEGAGAVSVIYLAGGEKGPYYWLMDFNDSSYVEIRKADLVNAREAIDDAMKKTKERLEGMPPDQKKQAEAMLAERYGALFKSPVEYKQISSGATVGRWTCDHFQGFRDGEKAEEVWSADLKQLGIDGNDLKALKEMADLFATLGQTLPAFFRFGGEKSQGDKTFSGFAVMMVSYEQGKRKEKWQVADVRREAFDAGLFKLPRGLKKKEMGLAK